MGITDDPTHPGLRITGPDGLQDAYLVLSEEERAKGFVRPLRRAYVHVGLTPPLRLRDLTTEEQVRYAGHGYVKFEPYPDSEAPVLGRFWTQDRLDRRGCGAETRMGLALCETYARDPAFYGSTFCVSLPHPRARRGVRLGGGRHAGGHVTQDPFNTAQAELRRSLEKLAKWRGVLAAWQLGTRSIDNAECQAVRDHRELTILMRAELNALVGLCLRQGLFSEEEYQSQLSQEASALDQAYEAKFPGISTSAEGIHYDVPVAVETMKGWLP